VSWALRTPNPAAMRASVLDRPITADPFRAPRPDFLSPVCRAAIANHWRVRMSSDIRFALVRKPTDPDCKPFTFKTLGELADFVQRERGDAGIQAFDAPVFVFDEDTPRQGVSIFKTFEGERGEYLGWAYLDGRGVAPLKAALEAARPDVPTIGKRAA
jgi:hypothetical protein